MKKLLLALLLCSCRPLTDAEHVQNARGSLEVVRGMCRVYLLKADMPRDPVLDRDCPPLAFPKESPP